MMPTEQPFTLYGTSPEAVEWFEPLPSFKIAMRTPPGDLALVMNNRTLLRITADGEVDGELEDMGEAAAVFVRIVREIIARDGLIFGSAA